MSLSESPVELAVAGAALVTAVLTWKYLTRPAYYGRLPPGPKRLPIIGNLFDMQPGPKPWLSWQEWSKTHGDLMYMEALGKRILVLNSTEAAHDLLDKRSATYSDRDRWVMPLELMDWDFNFAMIRYGDQWRTCRRLFQETMNVNAVAQYEPIQLRSARQFLKALMDTQGPVEVHSLVRHAATSTIMDAVYGIEISPKSDPYVTAAEESTKYLEIGGQPLTWAVDFIPALKYIPSWFPGAYFQKLAARAREANKTFVNRPYQAVQHAMATGNAAPGMVSKLIDEYPEESMQPYIKKIAATAYAGGADTTVSTVTLLFLAMANHPDVLAKAQAELDSVLGPNELPDFSHRLDLPYIQAMWMELTRWQPVLPLIPPHKSTQDDEYRGYMIPKGTMVISNNWALVSGLQSREMLTVLTVTNPGDYPEPEQFNPERFLLKTDDGKWRLNSSVRDPRTAGPFGWGRRICAGIHFAEQSLFVVISNVLAAFDISAPLNAAGEPDHPLLRMHVGLLCHPEHFKCVIKPRSERAAQLVTMTLPDRGL